jgi:gliding motility-associated-like protein
MKKYIRNSFLALLTMNLSAILLGQTAPSMGSLSSYVFFTSNGNVSNNGNSKIIGDIGTNSGSISGFTYNINGTFHDTDGSTSTAASDLISAYNALSAQTPTSFPGNTLGNGQTLTPAVHGISGSATINGDLYLDGQGDTNSCFIIKISGNLQANALSKVILTNGTQACRVFWLINGTTSLSNGAVMKGNCLTNGNITFATNANLEGRCLTKNGTIILNLVRAFIPLGCGLPELIGPNYPNVGSLGCFSIFNDNGSIKNTGTTNITGDVGTNSGIVDGFDPAGVNGMIHYVPDAWTIQGEIDNLALYNELNAVSCDIELLEPILLGYGLRLTPHTYCLGSNTKISDTLYFDAQGNPDAVFIMQVGGNFDANSYSNVVLLDSAQARNIFWVISGNVGIAPFSIFRGTIIAANGAETILENVFIEGRLLSHGGAIKTKNVNIVLNETPNIITPDGPLTFCQGDSVVLTAPESPTYLWSTGATSQSITVFTSGRYSVDVIAPCNNLASNIHLDVTVIPAPFYQVNLSICQGDSALINGVYRKTAGNYDLTYPMPFGCDSVFRTTLTVNPIYLTNLSAEICQGESILLGGANQTTAGIYYDTLSTSKGCDSVLRTTLTVNPVYLTNLSAEICQGESIMLGGSNQTTAGIYYDTLATNKGCDSVLRTTLSVNPVYLTNLSAEICQGESILLGGSNQTTAGIYYDTLATNKGCDSVLRTTLTVNPVYLTNLTAEICQGESILLGGASQTTAGIYYDTLATNKGCDSVLRTTLTVNPVYLTNLTAEICQGESILLGGANQTTAGIYFDTLSTNKGCDSVLRTTLTVNPVYLTNLTAEICQGESILLGGASQTTAGIYYDTLSTNKGCDSVLRTTLTVNPVYLTNLTAEICQGESIMLGGASQTTAGIYYDTLSTNKGCDSVLRTTLTVNPVYLTNLSAEICQGESILLGGANQTTAGIYYDTLSTNKGCDSVLRTTLTVNPVYLTNLSAEICQGESIMLGGASQTTAGIYYDTLATNKGCDSVLRTTLTVNPVYLTNLTAEICQGESILLGGSNQTTAGIYYDTLYTNKGCDSVLRTTLTVNPVYLTNLSAEICQGESILLGGSNQTTAGIYYDTLSTNKGCDSVLRTTLTVNPVYLTNLSAEICQGESILLGGSNQTTAGIYFDTLATNKGCDSVLRTTLTVNPVYLTNLTAEICQGESILLGGSNQTTAGIYYDTLSTNKGCDSVLRTTLSVNPIYLTNLSAEICQGESILLGGANQTTAGIYYDTLSTNKGCDSVLRTTLTVNPVYLTNLTAEICQGESILLGGSSQTTAGIYYDTLATDKGCDSVLRTTLTVNPVYSINQSTAICQGDSILLAGAYRDVAGIYTENLLTQKGCDSIITTNLTILPVLVGNNYVAICEGDSILLAGEYRTEPGVYVDSLTNNDGCDSILYNVLLVNPVEMIDIELTFCHGDSVFVYGEFQTEPGIYYDSLTTNLGCDSIIRTTLIFLPEIITTVNLGICHGDSVLLGGNFVSVPGIYFDTLQTQNGCDSIIETKLKVYKPYNLLQTISICEGDSIFLAGAFRDETGIYIDSLISNRGCDSIISYALVVNPIYQNETTVTICQGDSIFIGGAYQNLTGVYTDILTSINGCDSLVTVNLNVTPLPISEFNMTEDGPGDLNFQCFNLSQNESDLIWYFGDGETSTESDPIHDYATFDNYTVMLIVSNGCGVDTSIQLLSLEPIIDFYNALSPNGDGKNDYWSIPILDYWPDNVVRIINRWGVVVWKTEDYNNSTNRFIGENMNGDKLGDGTYYYILEYDRTEKRGWVFIER